MQLIHQTHLCSDSGANQIVIQRPRVPLAAYREYMPKSLVGGEERGMRLTKRSESPPPSTTTTVGLQTVHQRNVPYPGCNDTHSMLPLAYQILKVSGAGSAVQSASAKEPCQPHKLAFANSPCLLLHIKMLFMGAILNALLCFSLFVAPSAQANQVHHRVTTPKSVFAHFMVGNTYPYTVDDWTRGILSLYLLR